MRVNRMYQIILIFLFISSFWSCKQNDEYKKNISDPLLFTKTVKKLNDIILENNFPPMIAARNYAYASIAAYECMAGGDSLQYKSLSGIIKHMPSMPRPSDAEINFPLASLLSYAKVGNSVTFPEGSMMDFYNELIKTAKDAGMPTNVVLNTQAYSDTIVASILKWSKLDNYAETRSSTKYTVTNEEGRWVPTPPMYAQALEPNWKFIRPLLLDSASQIRAISPYVYNVKNTSSPFYKQMLEVKNLGDTLTEEQKQIADFWDDNPFTLNVNGHVQYAIKKFSPAGHWMNIVGTVLHSKKTDFNMAVYAYTKTSIALFEGFISCWFEKYENNYVRPETVINHYLDENWRPHIQTPPFPSYTSGHSVISAAAAEVLTDIFGDNFSYTDSSQINFGLPARSFTSFRNAALEASISRLYGGIHYRMDLENGTEQGKEVGKYTVEKLQLKN